MGSWSALKHPPWVSLAVIGVLLIRPYLIIASVSFAILLAFLAAVYVVLVFRGNRSEIKTRGQRLKFMKLNNWNAETTRLKVDPSSLETRVFAESFLISEMADDFIGLIVQEFIDPWFTKISQDRTFQEKITIELRLVFSNLKTHFAAIDLPSFLVLRLVPIITAHFAKFSGSFSHQIVDYSMEYKLSVAKAYKNDIHRGVSMDETARAREKEFLREVIGRILPKVLSEREQNLIVHSLIQEIVACTVLANVFELLSEADFVNQIIVKLVGENLKHRAQAKKLREALEKHTHSGLDLPKGPVENCICEWEAKISSVANFGDMDAIVKRLESEPQSYSISTLCAQVLAKKTTMLESMLGSPERSAVLREHLLESNHELELDLWQAIDALKAPLEESNEGTISLKIEFSTLNDINSIYKIYFKEANIPIEANIHFAVEEFVNLTDEHEKLAKSNEAREALFSLQTSIFQRIRDEYLRDFKESPNMLPSPNRNSKLIIRQPSLAFAGVSEGSQNTKESDDSALAIESAFEEIMKSLGSETNLVSKVELATKAEVGRSESVVPGSAATSSDNRLSVLFEQTLDDISESNSSEDDSLELSELSDGKLGDSQLYLAAPGDLSLTEQIQSLDNVIEHLSRQDLMLTSLLRKAELTNNIMELKVLRRSHAGIQREIAIKELQKQQFIVQENENSLYGKSRIRIQSCVFEGTQTSQYTLYIIEVQKYLSDDPSRILAGWVVARRYSQFFKLHEYLKSRYSSVQGLKFPKKSMRVLTSQKRQQTETRKPLLESYLRQLLQIQSVCSDPAFRSFLSSEEFEIGSRPSGQKKRFDTLLNKFYGDVKTRTADFSESSDEVIENIREMEQELRQFEEEERELKSFARPISDLLMTVFNLGKSNSWLRGRALLVILQQILGSTIHKFVLRVIETNILMEGKIYQYLSLAKDLIFPNRKFKDPPVLRTKTEQARTRETARVVFRDFLSETCSRVFGTRNTAQASRALFEMLQNDFIMKSLWFTFLEEIAQDFEN